MARGCERLYVCAMLRQYSATLRHQLILAPYRIVLRHKRRVLRREIDRLANSSGQIDRFERVLALVLGASIDECFADLINQQAGRDLAGNGNILVGVAGLAAASFKEDDGMTVFDLMTPAQKSASTIAYREPAMRLLKVLHL